jgi:serine/threonine protein kinase/lipopolysaccharide biosynthesis regulator YciM
MGEVFLAEDLKLERKVAIKTLLAKFIEDHHARRRLMREAKVAATLDHPNICSIHEVNDDGDSPFIVMQYIEGETLSSKIEDSALEPDEVLSIGIGIAEALVEAHSHGIIHRDIKPQNVIVTPRGQVKVLDFGLVKVPNELWAASEAETESRLTQEGTIVGTVAYMSPEQLMGSPIDARSDLFSLGVTLYECATGKQAFTGKSKTEISSKVLLVEPSKPSHFKPGIPLGLEDIIVKAMAKEVEARYQSAGELLEDLRSLQASLSVRTEVLTRPVTEAHSVTIASLAEPLRRNPVKSVFLALFLIAVIAGFLYVRGSSPHEPSPEAKTWYDQGLAAMRAGTYFRASKALEQSVELDNSYAPAHAKLAEAYLEINNTEKAMEELLRAVSLAANRPGLASSDAAYLDAIGATVRREFTPAIGYYQKILDQAADPEKANANVDLGRAYERNENLDKAVECYLEATRRDPQSPSGFLRLAVLYSRLQDLSNANAAFNKAEKLYEAMSNDEGRVEVLYQRGGLLARTGKLAEARAQLEQALEILKNADNKYQLVKTQLQLSLVSRDEGNLDRAKELAAEAIRLAQSANIKNIATQGLIDLGLALMSRGDFDETGKYLREALELARQDKSRSGEMRAILSLGRLNHQLGNNDEAISQLQDALNYYKPAGYRKETSTALTALGRAYQEKGEEQTALKIFEEQLQLSLEIGDQLGIGESHMNLALLRGLNQEIYPEALSHLDEKVKIDQALGANVGLGFDQMNRGAFLWQLGRYAEASEALDAAFEIANRPGANYKAALAWVHLTRAQMALSKRDFAAAKKNSQLALDLSASQFPDVALQAKYCMGRAEAFSGAAEAGRKSCEEAVAMARNVKVPQLISTALLACAEVVLIANDPNAALGIALEAQKLFARSGQQDSEWRALLVAARASDAAGNKSAAYDYASQANALCARLEQKWGKEAYEGYLSRPDIQRYRSQSDQLLKRSK